MIPESECRELLAAAEIGRVVVSLDALPAALPVGYRVVDDAIVFRASPGTKLDAAVSHTVVGFEVDEIDPSTRSGWSVLVVGRSRVVADAAERAELEKVEFRSWVAREAPHYIKIAIERISGRRLGRRPRDADAQRAESA